MKRFFKYGLLLPLILSLLLLGGSFGPRPLPRCRYVTRADITFYQGTRQQLQTYLQPGKISSVLTFLRLTEPYGKVSTAQALPDSHYYCIRLYYSDGSQGVYRLQDYQYFSKNSDLWQKVSTSQAQLLYPLLHLLPPDM